MGALTDPVVFHGIQVLSGDVLMFRPVGWRRFVRRPFLAIVDVRDRSAPYLVRRHGDRVWKLPLGTAPGPRSCAIVAYRLAGIDRRTGSIVAAAVAERPGERVHHPSFDCGRIERSDEDLVGHAFRAAGIEVAFADGLPAPPLHEVRGPQDPPNRVIGVDEAIAPVSARGQAFVHRGLAKSLPWQHRSRR